MSIIKGRPENLSRTCEKHGEFQAKCYEILNGKFALYEECQACIEEEREINKIDREIIEQSIRDSEQKEALERAERKKRYSGLRERHKNSAFDNFDTNTDGQKIALKKAQDFAEGVLHGVGGNLVMTGKVGTGKTHLAAATVNLLLGHDKSVRIIKVPELLRLIKSSWNGGEMTESDIIGMCSSVDLLILDEVGVQYGSDTEKLIVSEIIDNRYQEMLPTMLISNLDASGIRECIGERCYDRLKEDGGKVVAFDWDSYRGKK